MTSTDEVRRDLILWVGVRPIHSRDTRAFAYRIRLNAERVNVLIGMARAVRNACQVDEGLASDGGLTLPPLVPTPWRVVWNSRVTEECGWLIDDSIVVRDDDTRTDIENHYHAFVPGDEPPYFYQHMVAPIYEKVIADRDGDICWEVYEAGEPLPLQTSFVPLNALRGFAAWIGKDE